LNPGGGGRGGGGRRRGSMSTPMMVMFKGIEPKLRKERENK
jgi:hypothetical protein